MQKKVFVILGLTWLAGRLWSAAGWRPRRRGPGGPCSCLARQAAGLDVRIKANLQGTIRHQWKPPLVVRRQTLPPVTLAMPPKAASGFRVMACSTHPVAAASESSMPKASGPADD